jgi:hypothetical protein
VDRDLIRPHSSRVARILPLLMSLLAQSGIEQMGEPDTCFLQLLSLLPG